MSKEVIHKRAEELLSAGLTRHRAVRRLRREFPWAEILLLHESVGLGPTGLMPLWAQLGSPLHPVTVRGKVKRVDEMRSRHA